MFQSLHLRWKQLVSKPKVYAVVVRDGITPTEHLILSAGYSLEDAMERWLTLQSEGVPQPLLQEMIRHQQTRS